MSMLLSGKYQRTVCQCYSIESIFSIYKPQVVAFVWKLTRSKSHLVAKVDAVQRQMILDSVVLGTCPF